MLRILLYTSALLLPVIADHGKTTRYWDCCKPSCSWKGKAPVTMPVHTCNKDDQWDWNADLANACGGGDAFACSNTSPWVGENDVAYGFAAVKLAGKGEDQTCCSCYELKFTTTSIAGKTMIVQAINTGGDLGQNHFDLTIPGGGVGLFDACTKQFNGAPLGDQYGGYHNRNDCYSLPDAWRGGCLFRFDWFQNADNPEMEFNEIACPKSLIDRSGCART
ncbi:beta-1,4-endoglucanase [Lindgomyces ingoldianus]|uniref:Beta-1,4-endoglucanase n=1 Tax=Lindgomyces ingoldianus TaxID=673940 RepID=A0ACB6QI36_9PLEO|nr:beta-1,4-endoglucanase [Lindgomyces ingoldianus]KAF2466253.1 beta-1,4-endoglucanase [Lindgomyces ingoldianus]